MLSTYRSNVRYLLFRIRPLSKLIATLFSKKFDLMKSTLILVQVRLGWKYFIFHISRKLTYCCYVNQSRVIQEKWWIIVATRGVFLVGPHSLGCLIINFLSWGETYQYSQYKVLNLTNLQINTILYINFSDVNYININDGHM